MPLNLRCLGKSWNFRTVMERALKKPPAYINKHCFNFFFILLRSHRVTGKLGQILARGYQSCPTSFLKLRAAATRWLSVGR